MNKIQLHLLAFIFAAFLPPKSKRNNEGQEEGEEYYTILGLDKSCTSEQIRKAYKKKSLQYHPDKVAQFAARNPNKRPDEIQADFVKIKEAYEILSDVKKRNAYDVLGLEGSKMFDTEGVFMDPNMLAMNLATASFVNKTKLFLLVLLSVSIVLLGPILICVKIDSVYHDNENGWLFDTPWVYILIPIWIFNGIILLLLLLSLTLFPLLKMISLFVLEVFLALKWDNSIQWQYAIALIPLFLHQTVALVENIVILRKIQHDVARMVTVSYLEEKILPTFRMDDVDQPEVPTDVPVQKRYYNDLNEDEKEFINELYIIVGQKNEDDEMNPFQEDEEKGDGENPANKVDPEVKVLFDIAESTEFKLASFAKDDAERNMTKLIFTRIPFLVLLVLQLDQDRGWNWNLVFCPIWIEVIMETIFNCFLCCCHGEVVMPSREEYIYDNVNNNEEGGEENEKDQEEVKEDEKVEIKANIEASENNLASNIDEQKAKNEDQSRDSESGFAPVSFSPLISTETENVDEKRVENDTTEKLDSKPEASSEDDADDDDDDDDEYASTDPEVIQRRSQALGRCCNNLFIIIFLSMFLVKLNAGEDEFDNRGDFSAFWMIFPLLLVAGLVLCCCGCCIYSGVNQEQVDNIMRKSGVRPKQDKPDVTQDNRSEVEQDVRKSVSPTKTGFDDLD